MALNRKIAYINLTTGKIETKPMGVGELIIELRKINRKDPDAKYPTGRGG